MPYYHWDLIVVAVINAILSVFGLPFMHPVLPHSPLHVRCLADVETRVEGGYAKDVVTHVRETRLTNIFSNVAIGISLLFLQYVLKYVPKAVWMVCFCTWLSQLCMVIRCLNG